MKKTCIILLIALLVIPSASASAVTEFTPYEIGSYLSSLVSSFSDSGDDFDIEAFIRGLNDDVIKKVDHIIDNELYVRKRQEHAQISIVPDGASKLSVGEHSISPGIYAIRPAKDVTFVVVYDAADKALNGVYPSPGGVSVISVKEGNAVKVSYGECYINLIKDEPPIITKPDQWIHMDTSLLLVGVHIPEGRYKLSSIDWENDGSVFIHDDLSSSTQTTLSLKVGTTQEIELKAGITISPFFSEILFLGN